MAGICKDKCGKYKTTKRYEHGAVRCNYCEKFMMWEGLWCPCCGCKVRSRPKENKQETGSSTYLRDRRRKIFDDCLWAWKHERIHHNTRKRYHWLKQESLDEILYNCFKPLFKT